MLPDTRSFTLSRTAPQEALGLNVGLNEVDSLLNGAQVFLLFIRDFDLESVFKSHHEFNRVKAVGTEIFDVGGFILDVGLVLAKLFSDDLLDFLFQIFHFLLRGISLC